MPRPQSSVADPSGRKRPTPMGRRKCRLLRSGKRKSKRCLILPSGSVMISRCRKCNRWKGKFYASVAFMYNNKYDLFCKRKKSIKVVLLSLLISGVKNPYSPRTKRKWRPKRWTTGRQKDALLLIASVTCKARWWTMPSARRCWRSRRVSVTGSPLAKANFSDYTALPWSTIRKC